MAHRTRCARGTSGDRRRQHRQRDDNIRRRRVGNQRSALSCLGGSGAADGDRRVGAGHLVPARRRGAGRAALSGADPRDRGTSACRHHSRGRRRPVRLVEFRRVAGRWLAGLHRAGERGRSVQPVCAAARRARTAATDHHRRGRGAALLVRGRALHRVCVGRTTEDDRRVWRSPPRTSVRLAISPVARGIKTASSFSGRRKGSSASPPKAARRKP